MSDTAETFDLIVLGGGSAGLTAVETALIFNKKIALVVERLGGDCLWTGCVPSKALISAAAEAKAKGLNRNDGWALAQERIQSATSTIEREHDNPGFYERLGVTVYEGTGAFVSKDTLLVNGHKLRGRKFLVATGSRARVPEIPGLETVSYLTNETLFSMQQLPASMTIIGGGPIGCELSQALQNLGCHTTLIQNGPRIMPKDEPEASAVINEVLLGAGVSVQCNANVSSVAKNGEGVTATISIADETREITAGALLVATGRMPNIEGLGLEQAEVNCNDRGIIHDRYMRTTNKRVWTAGDVAGDFQFTHFASVQAGAAVQNMFVPFVKSRAPANTPWCTFTTPEVAHAGLTTEMAKKKGLPFEAISFSLAHVDRAVAENKTKGLVQLVIGGGEKILGGTVVAPHAGEMIQELTMAVNNSSTVEQLLKNIHVYPTYSSGIQQALFYRFKSKDTLFLRVGKFLARLT